MEGMKLYGSKGFEAAQAKFKPEDIADMTGKVVAVTGANKGEGEG